ncbi:MAG: hemolysin family protein [candidate division WOR-3 bacterium]
MVWYLLGIAICLLLSGLFSGSETALFSIAKPVLMQLKEAKPKIATRLEKLLTSPAQLLSAILFSNLVVNVIASSVWTLFIIALTNRYHLATDLYLGMGFFVMTLLLLIFGEVTPKVLASRSSLRFAILTSPLILGLTKIFSPIVKILTLLGTFILRHAKLPTFPSDEELLTMIELGRTCGTITVNEGEILHNLVELDKRTVSEVMTPRIKIAGLEKNTTCDFAMEFAKKTGFSRFPVYDQTIDNIVGILYVKDLLTENLTNRSRFQESPKLVSEMMRRVYFVPEMMKLSLLLMELRKKGSHIAIVVDEFGQTAGLVTLEDILEAIFGEIRDEFDFSEDLPYSKLDEQTYLVAGEIDLRTLNRIFDYAFKGLNYKRLSSFILAHFNRLPKVGETFTFRKLRLEIKTIKNNQIEKVLIQRV